MADFSLDAARRARAEKAGEGHTFEWQDRDWDLPAELPALAAFAAADEDFLRFVELLLGSQAEEFWSFAPSLNDLTAFAEGVAQLYAGIDAGESPASDSSSGSTTKSARRSSSASTASTSARASGGPRPLASAG